MERQHFHQELEQLKITILKMAALTQESLENATRAYLDRIEEIAGVPIVLVSVGARREETIMVKDLFG